MNNFVDEVVDPEELLTYEQYLNHHNSYKIHNAPWCFCMKICLQIYASGKTPFLQQINTYDTSIADESCSRCAAAGRGPCVKLFASSFDFQVKLRNVGEWFLVRMDEVNTARAKRKRKRVCASKYSDTADFAVDARQLYILGRAIMVANKKFEVSEEWRHTCICIDECRQRTKVTAIKNANVPVTHEEKLTVPSVWCEQVFRDCIQFLWQRVVPDLETIVQIPSAYDLVNELVANKIGEDLIKTVDKQEHSWKGVNNWIFRVLLFLAKSRINNCKMSATLKDDTPALRQRVAIAHSGISKKKSERTSKP